MQKTPIGEIPGLANIKRVVVMMFENRSFDHIFGALPNVNGVFEGDQINKNYYNLANPLKAPSELTNPPFHPKRIDPFKPQSRDFTHDFGDGMMPDLFGPTFTVSPAGAGPSEWGATYTSGYANGQPIGQVQPTQTYPATNSGFYSTFQGCEKQGQAALTYFENGALKVLHTLAKNFVVCDSWHCDMPGHTEPNRCFIHCGTTGSVGIDDPDSGINFAPTVFQLIGQLPVTSFPSGWKIYVPVANNGGALEPIFGQSDTNFLNPKVPRARYKYNVPITEFAEDCKEGTLPFYSFIMCWLPHGHYDDYTDTSMHPNSLIQPGENLLAAVYNTLRNSPCWDDTLLVVTFDENGGIYDHVFPPNTTPPNPGAPVTTQYTQGCCGNNWTLDSTFDFSLLGLRVPALLISPWLAPGIDSHQYQNTSVLRFLIDKMNAEFGTNFQALTQRDATAPTLESAFSQHGQVTKREDCPSNIAHYKKLPSVDPKTNSDKIPYNEGVLTTWIPPTSNHSVIPVSYTLELLNTYVAPLPGHPDSGKKITQIYRTNAEVSHYTEERAAAAEQFYRKQAA